MRLKDKIAIVVGAGQSPHLSRLCQEMGPPLSGWLHREARREKLVFMDCNSALTCASDGLGNGVFASVAQVG